MPTEHPAVYRPLFSQDRHTINRTHEIVARSFEILQQNPTPDTFLGRKTQEPFPSEDDRKAIS